MTQLPPVTSKDQLAPADQHVFDEIGRERGRVSGPFPVLLNSPILAQKVAAVGEVVRFHNSIPRDLNELAIITVGREFDCQFEFTRHVEMARKAGAREDAIQAIAQKKPLTGLTADESLVVQFAQEMVRSRQFTDATWEKAVKRFGNKGSMDLAVTVAYYVMMCHILLPFEVKLGPEEKAELPGGR